MDEFDAITKAKKILAISEFLTGLEFFGGAIFLFFLVEPIAHRGGHTGVPLWIIAFKVAGVLLLYPVISSIISGIRMLKSLPRPAKTPLQTCLNFYWNLITPNKKKAILAYVCLTDAAREEYGGYDTFRKTWDQQLNSLKSKFLKELRPMKVTPEPTETTPEPTDICISFQISVGDEQETAIYESQAHLIKNQEEVWVINSPISPLCPKPVSET